eukprot:s1646_g8.t1
MQFRPRPSSAGALREPPPPQRHEKQMWQIEQVRNRRPASAPSRREELTPGFAAARSATQSPQGIQRATSWTSGPLPRRRPTSAPSLRTRVPRDILEEETNFIYKLPTAKEIQAKMVMMDGWMDGWMDGGTDGWMAGWLAGWMMAGWLDGWMAGRLDGWMAGWMAGWLAGWMDGWMDACMHACMHACMYVCLPAWLAGCL